MLLKVRNLNQEFPYSWPDILKELEQRRLKLKITKVLWKFLEEGRVKYNTDGALGGNPDIGSYAFFLRDEYGDLIYTQGDRIEETTNVETEVCAILKVATHCSHT